MAGRRVYIIESKFLPEDLFQILKKTCERGKFRDDKPDFDFDWMKRRIEVSARSEEGARGLAEAVARSIEARAGGGQLLPGEPVRREGRIAIPIGVLIQTPDVYAEMLAQMLREMGISGVRLEENGEGFSFPGGPAGKLIDFQSIIKDFPLPHYLKIREKAPASD